MQPREEKRIKKEYLSCEVGWFLGYSDSVSSDSGCCTHHSTLPQALERDTVGRAARDMSEMWMRTMGSEQSAAVLP